MKVKKTCKKKTAYKLNSKISILSIVLVIFLFFFLPHTDQTRAQVPNQPQTQINEVNFENNTVYMGIWLNNIYSYDYKAGSYTLDMYLYFFWVNPNITSIDWYLMNGYPVNPATTLLVSSNLTTEVKNEIYRITAACSNTPDASDFPFDSIKIVVAVELITQGQNLEIAWLENETGIDPGFMNAGWVTTNVKLTTSNHVYPLGVELPRAEMVITQQRQRPSTSLQNFVPPAVFAIVSVFSFLFSLKEASAVGLRLGLNTSMLVTTLLFNFTISTVIPPASTITIYSLVILSILIFIVMNLMVTIIGFVQWFYYKNERQTKRTNRWGFILSISVPIVFFVILYFLRNITI
jgi:hypothetical protein